MKKQNRSFSKEEKIVERFNLSPNLINLINLIDLINLINLINLNLINLNLNCNFDCERVQVNYPPR